MKKTYLVPTMVVVPVQTNQMLCASPSVVTNVEFDYGGETPVGFGSDDIR